MVVLLGSVAGGSLARGVGLAEKLAEVTAAPQFKQAQWGILVVDLKSGETLVEQNADRLFVPASVTKLFSVAAALDALGAEHRFKTPILARGDVSAEGELAGDLILVASGDLTMGGRTDPVGRIAFVDSDHTYADFSPTAELTMPDPLAGLDELAGQVAAAGIKRVRGEVYIDDRMFDVARGTGSGPGTVTPILVNDNMIDLLVTPGEAGQPASVTWRPKTSAFEIDARVETVAADQPAKVDVTLAGERRLTVRGKINSGRKPLLRMHAVEDPAGFARSLLIEALLRQGVAVDASPLSRAASPLPRADEYSKHKRVAELVSPPFSESARLILKVSHNLHASTLPLLVANKRGGRNLEAGLRGQREFLLRAGVDADTISFGGGAGGDRGDYVTPRAAVTLLRHMAGRPDAAVYRQALPLLGVDGTLASAVKPESPARGKAAAKTGTLLWANTMNGKYLLTSKALAGYLTTVDGRELAFALFVNNVHLDKPTDSTKIGENLGRICEILYQAK